MDHKARARTILETNPEIKTLFGPDWTSAPIAAIAAASHTALAVHSASLSTLQWILAAYAFGAWFAQFGFLAIHELSHDLVFRTSRTNKLFSILINLPLVFPFAIVFRKYHFLHHAHQGTKLDFDLPSEFEAKVFRGAFGKFVWLASQLAFYALRPCVLHPVRPCFFGVLNMALQAMFNACMICLCGCGPLKFLFVSLLFAGGLHPCSGHFLSEHVQFRSEMEQDTFSYYGSLNSITWNVGFHCEHHDFPRIAWRRLPRVRGMARESYSTLFVCESWSKALVEFVTNEKLTLGGCRARRHPRVCH